MNSKILFFLGLAALAAADKRPSYSYGAPQDSSSDESSEPAKYDFEFEVKDGYSGSDFEHEESRDDENTKGSYSVQLPDGRLQKVTYYIDGDSGYVAEVSYEGEARYPDSAESQEYSAPRPSYSAPRQSYTAPDSDESREKQSYSPPRRGYGVPN